MSKMHPIDEMLKLSLEGEHDRAWEISEELEKLGPEKILDPQGKNTTDIWLRHCFNRGWHLIQRGEFNKGCQLIESGRFLNTYGGGVLKTPKPLFNRDQHQSKDKSIILSLEGGYGDEIIHARFATHLKRIFKFAKVYIACDPSLGALMSRIEGVDGIITRAEADTVEHDYWLPGFSAAWVCGFEHDTLPGQKYLSANPLSVNIWRNLIKSDKPKVGIRWAGNPKFEHQQFRIFNPNFLIKMAEAFPDVQFYSFQRDSNLEKLPENITDLQSIIISWEDTAAALECMDLVISSCTSVAHLAAAMGKPTWVITPILPYHTWAAGAPGKPGERGSKTSPWYDSTIVYRQLYKSKWQPTFDELYKDLEHHLNMKRAIEIPSYEEIPKRLNLGCGYKKLEDFINVDKSADCKPDQIVDLAQERWPFEDNEFTHIVAKESLESIDMNFFKIIKEMYRISKNGAVWEIQVTHPRSDKHLEDPSKIHTITDNTFRLFDRDLTAKLIESGNSVPLLGYEHGIDLTVADVKYEFNDFWKEQVKKQVITADDVYKAAKTMNNVIDSVIMLIQIHKPVRREPPVQG